MGANQLEEAMNSMAAAHNHRFWLSSLIAQSHPVRSYSEVFEGGAVRRYPDLGAKLAELRTSL